MPRDDERLGDRFDVSDDGGRTLFRWRRFIAVPLYGPIPDGAFFALAPPVLFRVEGARKISRRMTLGVDVEVGPSGVKLVRGLDEQHLPLRAVRGFAPRDEQGQATFVILLASDELPSRAPLDGAESATRVCELLTDGLVRAKSPRGYRQ